MLVSRLPEHDKAYSALVASLAPARSRLPTLVLSIALIPTCPATSIPRAYTCNIHHCLQSIFPVRNACSSLDRPTMEGNQGMLRF